MSGLNSAREFLTTYVGSQWHVNTSEPRAWRSGPVMSDDGAIHSLFDGVTGFHSDPLPTTVAEAVAADLRDSYGVQAELTARADGQSQLTLSLESYQALTNHQGLQRAALPQSRRDHLRGNEPKSIVARVSATDGVFVATR